MRELKMVPPADNGQRSGRLGALIAVALVLGAVGSLVYGAAVHKRPVMMDLKMAQPGAPAGFAPVYETITLVESEPELVREVTYGGVTRLPTGETKRTYTGKPPSLCPT